MNPIIVISILFLVVGISVVLFFIIKKKASNNGESSLVQMETKGILDKHEQYEMNVRFEDLPALTEQEEARLVEIKDKALLAQIDVIIPGAMKVVANAGAAKQLDEMAKAGGKLYMAIIPKGAELAKVKDKVGVFRGFFHGKRGIAGHAELVPVKGNLGGLAAVNAGMAIAAAVVGQYYMTQINNQLSEISSDIKKIADFQDDEYRSKVYALVAEMQKASTFQAEIIENDELRNRELAHLRSLEHQCAEQLGQANLTIQRKTNNRDLDFKEYEKKVAEIQPWFQYQQILLEVMYKIAELTYALNLGMASKENSYALFQPYANQSEETLEKLKNWHVANIKKFGIDVTKKRRKLKGIEGFFMGALGKINDDMNYKDLSRQAVKCIENQTSGKVIQNISDQPDLYQEDVKLIVKDGKMYFLPSE